MAANAHDDEAHGREGPLVSPTVLLLLGIAAALGCSAPLEEIRAPKPGRTLTPAWNGMHQVAAKHFACSIGALTTKQLSNNGRGTFTSQSFEISGCGKAAIFLIQEHDVEEHRTWTVFSDVPLRTNLQFKAGGRCPTWKVEFIDDATRGVTFCGEKAVYVLSAGGWTAQ